MKITHTVENDICFISSQGQLALNNVSDLDDYIAPFHADESNKGIVLDFSEVTFVDSKGVSLIILTNMKLQNQKLFFALINVNKKIMEVFNLSGLSNHIKIHPDKNTALKEIGG